MQQTIRSEKIPYTLTLSKESTHLFPIEGHYDSDLQQWSERGVCSVTTWSRSSTTGVIIDDPDEDKDD